MGNFIDSDLNNYLSDIRSAYVVVEPYYWKRGVTGKCLRLCSTNTNLKKCLVMSVYLNAVVVEKLRPLHPAILSEWSDYLLKTRKHCFWNKTLICLWSMVRKPILTSKQLQNLSVSFSFVGFYKTEWQCAKHSLFCYYSRWTERRKAS